MNYMFHSYKISPTQKHSSTSHSKSTHRLGQSQFFQLMQHKVDRFLDIRQHIIIAWANLNN